MAIARERNPYGSGAGRRLAGASAGHALRTGREGDNRQRRTEHAMPRISFGRTRGYAGKRNMPSGRHPREGLPAEPAGSRRRGLLGRRPGGGRRRRGRGPGHADVVKQGRLSDPRTLVQFYATKNRDVDEAVKLAERSQVRGGPYTDDAPRVGALPRGQAARGAGGQRPGARHGTRDADPPLPTRAPFASLPERPRRGEDHPARAGAEPEVRLTGAAERRSSSRAGSAASPPPGSG